MSERNEDELSDNDTTESVYEDAMSLHIAADDDQFLEAVDLFQGDLSFSAGNPGLPINLSDNSLSLDEILLLGNSTEETIPEESDPSQPGLSPLFLSCFVSSFFFLILYLKIAMNVP